MFASVAAKSNLRAGPLEPWLDERLLVICLVFTGAKGGGASTISDFPNNSFAHRSGEDCSELLHNRYGVKTPKTAPNARRLVTHLLFRQGLPPKIGDKDWR